jgi:putrescine transport system substrate-binding protein
MKRTPSTFTKRRFTLLGMLLAISLHANADKELHIYNWDGYIGEHTVENFEKETGIKVTYDLFDSYETAEAKLLSGNSGYDIVNMSSYYMSRQISAGVWTELDKSKISNWKNLDPEVLKFIAVFDPGNKYSQPWSWYTTGIGYNKAEVAKRFGKTPDSWAMVFEPEQLKKISDCGFSWTDAASDLFTPGLLYYGLDPYSTTPADYETVLAKATPIRPLIRNFSNSYWNDLAEGETCLSISWSGDTASMEGYTKKGIELDFFLPKEGSYIDYDTMAIPAESKNKEEAYAFLNYLLTAKEAAAFTNYVKYPNSVPSSLPLIEKRLLDQHIVFYPTAAQKKILYPSKNMPSSIDRLQTRLWTKFKTSI